VTLHVSIFPRSSTGESQEYQSKFLNWVTLVPIHVLQFGLVFNIEYTVVKSNLQYKIRILAAVCAYGIFKIIQSVFDKEYFVFGQIEDVLLPS
jgi:hypothetical protein